jgi:hypothetical protein
LAFTQPPLSQRLHVGIVGDEHAAQPHGLVEVDGVVRPLGKAVDRSKHVPALPDESIDQGSVDIGVGVEPEASWHYSPARRAR